MTSSRLAGIYVPIVTPLARDGSVDLEALASLGEHVLERGAAGLVALGTTGEPASLKSDERQRVVEVCASVCRDAGRQLLVGPGSNDTASTIEWLDDLAQVGNVTAALCLAPYYVLPGQDGVAAHWRALADASPVPVVLYNIPSRTGQPVDAQVIEQLAGHRNVIGIKQSTPLDATALEVLARCHGEFSILCGEDPVIFPSVALGAAGAITASGHVGVETMVAMLEATRAGDLDKARQLHEELLPLVTALFAEPSPTVLKGVLHRLGLIRSPAVRLPLVPASSAAVETAMAALPTHLAAEQS